MNDLMKSKKFKIASMIIGGIIIVLLIFAAGVSVGIHKARFSYKFGENYERNFMGPERGMMRGPADFIRGMEGRDFRNAHGIAGTIISITDNNIVIKDRDNKENTIMVSDKTVIKRGRDDIKITDLKNDDRIVVMGKPGDNGAINADLVRVFDNNNSPDGQN
jgi:hypothetical protein